VIAKAAVLPAVKPPKLHAIAGDVTQVPCVGVAAKMEAPLLEKASERIIWEIVELPLFVTVITYPALLFAAIELGPVIETTRLATPGEGGAWGVTVFEGAEGALSPVALVALTTKVYCVPLFRPLTTRLVAGAGTMAPTPVDVPETSAVTV